MQSVCDSFMNSEKKKSIYTMDSDCEAGNKREEAALRGVRSPTINPGRSCHNSSPYPASRHHHNHSVNQPTDNWNLIKRFTRKISFFFFFTTIQLILIKKKINPNIHWHLMSLRLYIIIHPWLYGPHPQHHKKKVLSIRTWINKTLVDKGKWKFLIKVHSHTVNYSFSA